MNQFPDMRDFLLLKNPINPVFLLFQGRLLEAAEMVFLYDTAKASWEEYGDDGPPPESKVVMLSPGFGKLGGAVAKLRGIEAGDPRFFELYQAASSEWGSSEAVALVMRECWWAHMKVLEKSC
jgi:hypothetical protein